jgi:hypothetical protein
MLPLHHEGKELQRSRRDLNPKDHFYGPTELATPLFIQPDRLLYLHLRLDLNQDLVFRKDQCYPLHHGDNMAPEGIEPSTFRIKT